MEALLAMEHHEQVRVLERATFIGMVMRRHHLVMYYGCGDFYAGLFTTKCGLHFSLAFREGNEYRDMLENIALRGSPAGVGHLPKHEFQRAMLEEGLEEYHRDQRTFAQVVLDLASRGLDVRYAAALDAGRQMEFFRSLPGQEKAFLAHQRTHIGSGDFKHYHAHYYRMDDFFVGSCTTTDHQDFWLAFRDGRAWDDMVSAIGEVEK